MQFGVDTQVQSSSSHGYDDTFLFFAVPLVDMFLFSLSPGGAEVDLTNAINNIEIGGLVWTSSCVVTTDSPAAPTNFESWCETLYFQRTAADGSPLAFPGPWVDTPPFGGGFQTEQENLPVRYLSRRERLISAVDTVSNASNSVFGSFPVKSLRIRRRAGDYTTLVLQHSFTATSTDMVFRLRFSGQLYYRTRF